MPAPPELSALLNACRAAPADDTPRLVLADWLDEHGEADRAALIRVQCELDHPTLDAARTAALRVAERELILANWVRWAGDLPYVVAAVREARRQAAYPTGPDRRRPPADPPPADPFDRNNPWRFGRGLLCVELQPGDCRDPGFVAWCRTDEAVWLDATLELHGLGGLDGLDVPAEVRPYLGVNGHVTLYADAPPAGHAGAKAASAADLRRALGSANFGLVRELAVSLADDDSRTLHLLLAADVRRVTRLSLEGRGVTDAAVAALAAAPFDRLAELDVSRNQLGPAAARALAESRSMPALVVLSASANRFGDDGLAALADSPLADTLSQLEVMNNDIGDRGAAALARSRLVARLHSRGLNLSYNRVGNAGAKALAGCEYLLRFRELVLRENRVGDAGAKALAASPFAANLTYLDLWHNAVGDAGAKALAASEHLGGVGDLSLRDNRISARGARVLRRRYGDRAKV